MTCRNLNVRNRESAEIRTNAGSDFGSSGFHGQTKSARNQNVRLSAIWAQTKNPNDLCRKF